MYEQHFGFHRQPFQCAELSRAFFVSEAIRSILPQLLHAMRSDLGIAVLTGPPGVGKTSLLRHLQSVLSQEGRAVVCSGASLETPAEVLLTLQSASQLRAGSLAPADPDVSPARVVRWNVVEHLRKSSEFWGPVLLLIDDAQLLSVQVLNELRAFSEEQSNGRSLVRCLISGPLSFEEDLARSTHADFGRRIRCHAFLQPLTSRESIEFLSRHLAAVGGNLRDVFSSTSLEIIAAAADGIPRCLSLLADESLVVGAEQSRALVDDHCVHAALTRLQHLPYSWSVSPRSDVDCETTSVDPVDWAHPARATESNPSAMIPVPVSPSVGVVPPTFSPGVVEFGAGGIEFGAIRTMLPTPTVTTTVTLPAVVSVDANAIENPSESLDFEVGRRFVNAELDTDPNDAESEYSIADAAVDLDDAYWLNSAENRPASRICFVELSEQQCSASEEICPSKNDHGAQEAATQPAVDYRPEVAAERFFGQVAGAEFSNRVPVFDRYTWIALGREVPSGTYSVTSASGMQRVNSGLSFELGDLVPGSQCGSATAFDDIAVIQTTDQEIGASLLHSDFAAEHGEFEFFRTPIALPHQCGDSNDQPCAVRKDAIVDDNVATADVQITFFSGNVSLENSETQALQSIDNEKTEPATTHISRRLWDDGHLLFGPKPAAEQELSSTESSHLNALGEMASSLDAVQAAAPEQSNAAQKTENHFFTLPVALTAIDWDLRSALVDFDEMLPLAESVEAFRDEVTLFQQGSRRSNEDSSEVSDGTYGSAASDSHAAASRELPDDTKSPDDSLVARSRRRLESLEHSRASIAVIECEEQPAATAPLTGRSPTTALSQPEPEFPFSCRKLNSDNCAGLGTNASSQLLAASVVDSAPVSSITPQFGQLFTRLRKKRSQAAENR